MDVMWNCDRIRLGQPPGQIIEDVTVEFQKGSEMDLSGAGGVELAHLKSSDQVLGSMALFESGLELTSYGISISGHLVETNGSYVKSRLGISETWEMTVIPEN